jgi:hypothetical protein
MIRIILEFALSLYNMAADDADDGLNFQSLRGQKRRAFYDFYVFYELISTVSCGSDAPCLGAPPVQKAAACSIPKK